MKTNLVGNIIKPFFLLLILVMAGPVAFSASNNGLVYHGRILKPDGLIIISNLDLDALAGLDRLRCRIRILFHGLTRYRTRPPKGFSDHLMSEQQLCELLSKGGFKIVSTETFKDASRSSNIPVEYIKAAKA